MFTQIERAPQNPVVFIQTELIPQYMEVLTYVRRPFVLITVCNDDMCVPYMSDPQPNSQFRRIADQLLNSPNLIKWYTKNPCIRHEKIQPLPLGPKFQYVTTRFFGEPKRPIMDVLDKYCLEPARRFRSNKPNLLYFHYGNTTAKPFIDEHTDIRPRVREILTKTFPENGPKPFAEYMEEMSQYKFCISLPGRGVDTHRCWEALMMGTVPIMISTALDSLFDKLPVVLLPADFDWSTLSIEWLEERWIQLRQRIDYNFTQLYSAYWREHVAKSNNC
jgi:hypothetical protein